ncbi:hypothetical protein KBB06_04335 [Candidatus Gracilibacteria bacterium]|nr:hypothetical protein [Candidatus Gracilibacteria bacterium]
MIFFALLISINVIDQIRQSSAVNKANVVYYAAEGALEKGLLTNLSQGAGYNTSGNQTVLFNGDPECLGKANQTDCNTCCDTNYPGNTNSDINTECKKACKEFCDGTSGPCSTKGTSSVKSTFTVQGTVPISKKFDEYYTIPSPGTGDAAANCDPLKMDVSKTQFYYSKATAPNYVFDAQKPAVGDYTGPFYTVDHPCNWNKLGEGESVSIPLYVVYNSDPATLSQPIYGCYNPFGSTTWICNPEQLGLTELILKVRTPCKAGVGEMCATLNRMQLDTLHGDTNVGGDDTIVDWQVTASNLGGDKSYLMVPDRNFSINNCYGGRCPENSEIYESIINYGAKLSFGATSILQGEESGIKITDGNVLAFLKNESPWTAPGTIRTTVNDAINKPVLKLTVIRSLLASQTEKVPYLEYQVLVKSNKTMVSPTNAYQTISSESTSGSFRQILEVKVPQESGLLEYVVQQ